LAALDREPIITFTDRCTSVRQLERSLESRQLHLDVVLRSDDPVLIEELVIAGNGSALLPRIAVKGERNPSLSVYEIDSLAKRTIGLSSIPQRTASSGAARFTAAAEAAAARLKLQAAPA
jgi:DNA-binding transcriptional LysR family regulator